jgi:hypothetical protein
MIIVFPWPLYLLRLLYLRYELMSSNMTDAANGVLMTGSVPWGVVRESFEIAGAVSLMGVFLFIVILFFVLLARLWGSSKE